MTKSKTMPSKDEDNLRTLYNYKTAWLSKCMEDILADFILPIVDKYIDPGQCGGLKKSSNNHYSIKLIDFPHRTMDKRERHSAVLCTEDLNEAYDRGSHNLVIENLFSMHIPGWILLLLCKYLNGRSLSIQYP